MKTIVATLLPVFLSVLVGCEEPPSTPAVSEQTAQERESAISSQITEDEPRFWRDEGAVEAINLLEYDRAYVYRWNNGAVQLSGNFDTENARKPLRFDLAKMAPEQFQRSSGIVVVAITDGESSFQCNIVGSHFWYTDSDDPGVEWDWQERVDHDDKQNADEPYDPSLYDPSLPASMGFLRSSAIEGVSVSLDTYVDGEWTEFLEIAFSPATKE